MKNVQRAVRHYPLWADILGVICWLGTGVMTGVMIWQFTELIMTLTAGR